MYLINDLTISIIQNLTYIIKSNYKSCMTAYPLRPLGMTIINIVLCNYTHTGSHYPFTSEGLYRHSADLRTLNSYSLPDSQSIPACLTHITTPLHLEAWDTRLRNHPDRTFADYTLSRISHRFHIGFNHETFIRSPKGNTSSAADHAKLSYAGW